MNQVSVKLMGGLGNYMFQIACTFSYAKKTNKIMVLTINDSMVVHNNINTYLTNIFSNIKFKEFEIKNNYYIYNEPTFTYSEIPQINKNILLHGYFQSENYFRNYEKNIKELFSYPVDLKQETINKFQKKYGIVFNDFCSIHVRRGDYLKLPNHYHIQNMNYYADAMNQFDNNQIFLIFSDDINWCKNNFTSLNKNIIFVENTFDYEDLLYMSLCSHNIIANSSFSWWGAWLNKNKNKIVIAPKKWFGSALPHDTSDLYCKDWIII